MKITPVDGSTEDYLTIADGKGIVATFKFENKKDRDAAVNALMKVSSRTVDPSLKTRTAAR